MTDILKSVLSPRFYRGQRGDNSERRDQSVLKLGNLFVISGVAKHNAYIQVVKEDINVSANFYSDSDKTISFGSLSLAKCKISLSETDLSTIEVTKQHEDNKRKPGLLLRAKSQTDAKQWVDALNCKPSSDDPPDKPTMHSAQTLSTPKL